MYGSIACNLLEDVVGALAVIQQRIVWSNQTSEGWRGGFQVLEQLDSPGRFKKTTKTSVSTICKKRTPPEPQSEDSGLQLEDCC
jgi:hypothetical protein